MDIFGNIQSIAKDRGLSIVEIERALGFGTNTMRKWRDHSPGVDKLVRVADFLGCSIDEILGIKKEPAESELDDQLVRLLVDLPPEKVQRVKDFVAGLLGS